MVVEWTRALEKSPEYNKGLLYWFKYTGFGIGHCKPSEVIDGLTLDCFVGEGGFL